MTTIKALSSTELLVSNNGRTVRVSADSLLAVDEQVASCVRYAVASIGEEVVVKGDNRKPRHARVHGLLQ